MTKLLENGFIVLSRKICNWRWFCDDNTFRVFVYIILQANYEPKDFENITINRGQFVTSYPSLAKNLNLSVRQVRTAIKHLISTGEVTVTKYPKFSVYTVVNYDKYQTKRQGKRQSSDRVSTGKRQSSDTNGTKYNKANKETNINAAAEIHKPGDIAPMPPRRYVPDAPPPEIDYIGGAKD